MKPLPKPAGTPPVDQAPAQATWSARLRGMIRKKYVVLVGEHFSIRWRFRIVVIAFALPFLGQVVWSATEQAAIEKTHVRERALSLARLMSIRLDDHIEQVDRILATAAYSIGANLGDVAAMTALLQNMRTHVPTSVNNIAVWSLTGQNIAALYPTATTQSLNVADRIYFREAIARRGLAIQAPIASRTNGQTIAQFARPVFDRDNQVVAVITMSTRLRELTDQLDPGNLISTETLVTMIDRSGTIVARSIDPMRWVGKQIPQLDRLADAFVTRSGALELTGMDGQIRMSGYSASYRVPWVVYVGEPVETAIVPVRERLLKNLGLGFAVLILVTLLAGRIASSTIRPLLRLAADTNRLGAGDLGHRSAVVTGGEIATLAEDFNCMATTLERSQRQVREIADHMPAQISYIDREQRFRFVNAYRGRFSRTHGDEMLGKAVCEIRTPEVYRTIAPHIEKALAGEATSVEGVSVIAGEDFHFRSDYVPDRDADGTVRGFYAFTQDITERKLAEMQLAESEKRLVTITDNLPAMVCYLDYTRRFRFANRACEKWYGLPLADMIGRSFAELMPPELAAQYNVQFERGMKGETCEYELEVPVPGKGTRWLRSTFVPDVDEQTGAVKGGYCMIHNVTVAKEAEQRLTRLAQFDTLTGIPNRHQFNEKLAHALEAADRKETPLALMFLDIDHFKQVNDRYGHGGGDALLKEFAQRLAECVRPTDAVARLAGDEFVVLLEGLHSDEEPQFIARKIIASVQKPFMIEGHFMRVTTSIGIAIRVFETEVSMLMKRADEALYDAKRTGRNTFRMAG
ncbi:MAG: diguanylate cyclase domain-containing protein [Burkholderiaceae bacterium]